MLIGIFGLLLPLTGCTEEEALEQGADVLQAMPPIRDIDLVLSGFHYVSGNPDQQESAMHYCNRWSDDLTQCVLYDVHEKDAFMIGVEHVVSREVFESFPEEEKRLWHSHVYEVRSGLLIAPGLPLDVEEELMDDLVTTYGKTWHVWHPAEDPHPMGESTLMKSFTEDGQIDPDLVRARDEQLGVDTAERARERADIPDPGFDPITLEEPQVGVCEDDIIVDDVAR